MEETNDNVKYFYDENGLLHNDKGPGVLGINGNNYKAWLIHGKYHRLDGPAQLWDDGDADYYINGVSYCEEDYWNHPDVEQNSNPNKKNSTGKNMNFYVYIMIVMLFIIAIIAKNAIVEIKYLSPIIIGIGIFGTIIAFSKFKRG